MKKIIINILLLISFVNGFGYNNAQAAFCNLKNNKTNVEKIKKPGLYALSKFLVEYENAANSQDKETFLSLYSDDYISSDGFDKSIIEKIVVNTWKDYPGIKYKIKLNSVTFYDDIVIANVTETAKGSARTEGQNIAEFVSVMDSTYYLKPNKTSWVIIGDYTTKEQINLYWGDAKLSKIKLNAPIQISANQEYSAILSITQPEGVIAIGSINSDKITYPQKPSKEIFRKFSSDGKIERIMKTNNENTNEYVVATVGFTRPKLNENKNLDIKLSGYACVMKRINIIPINKFIEVKNETTDTK